MSSMILEYRCPKCGQEFLALSSREHRFYCGSCNKFWMIKELKK